MLNIYNTQYPFDPNMHVPNVLAAPTQFPGQPPVQQCLPAVSEPKPVLGQQTTSQNRKKIRRCHPVWEYFRLWQQEGKARQSATAHCKLCRRFEIPGATSQAATRHLKGMHREEYYKLCERTEGKSYGPWGERAADNVATSLMPIEQAISLPANQPFAVPINNNMITNTEHQPLRAKFSGLTFEFPDEKPQEEKPRSSIQLSPISMESPWSPPFLKMEEPQPEEEQRVNAPMVEEHEISTLLKMFTRRHDGLYECILCTFCASYDLNALRAHQDSTHRVQRYKPDPKSPHGCWIPGFEASLHDPRAAPTNKNQSSSSTSSSSLNSQGPSNHN